MSVECYEGFDTFTLAQVTRRYPIFTNANMQMVTGRNSIGQGIQGTSNADSLTLPVTGRSEYYFGLDWKRGSTNGNILSIVNTSAAAICTIAGGATESVTTTFGNSSTGVTSTGNWAQLWVYFKVSASVGVLTVKLDGVTIISLTGLNTGSVNIGGISLLGQNGSGPTFDNFWCFNTGGSRSNTFPTGTMTVQTLYPASDGTYTDWTPNSGSNHFSRVNNTTSDDDTTYVSATTVNNKDSYPTSSLSGTISQVHAVQASMTARKDDTPAKTIHLFVKSSSTLSESPDVSPTTSYAATRLLLDADPNTSAQWVDTDVNAAEIGVKIIA